MVGGSSCTEGFEGERALVETRNGILSTAKLALRPMTILVSLTLIALEVCFEVYEKALDNADDVIHGT